jgi:hypothetical protein
LEYQSRTNAGQSFQLQRLQIGDTVKGLINGVSSCVFCVLEISPKQSSRSGLYQSIVVSRQHGTSDAPADPRQKATVSMKKRR